MGTTGETPLSEVTWNTGSNAAAGRAGSRALEAGMSLRDGPGRMGQLEVVGGGGESLEEGSRTVLRGRGRIKVLLCEVPHPVPSSPCALGHVIWPL